MRQEMTFPISGNQRKLYKLIYALKQNVLRSSTLRAHLQCSNITLQRLLKVLRDQYQVEIEYSHSQKQYMVTNFGKFNALSMTQLKKIVSTDAGSKLKSPGRSPISLLLDPERLKVLDGLVTKDKSRTYHIKNALDLYFEKLEISVPYTAEHK
jgi:DNA-binding HxlR family transcriptional regulator